MGRKKPAREPIEQVWFTAEAVERYLGEALCAEIQAGTSKWTPKVWAMFLQHRALGLDYVTCSGVAGFTDTALRDWWGKWPVLQTMAVEAKANGKGRIMSRLMGFAWEDPDLLMKVGERVVEELAPQPKKQIVEHKAEDVQINLVHVDVTADGVALPEELTKEETEDA